MDIPTAITIVLTVTRVRFDVKLDVNELIKQLKKSPALIPGDLSITVSDTVNVSDNVSVSVRRSTFKLAGALSMVKTTNNPDQREFELIQTARGNRPYNSIFDVQISYDEGGNITSIKWTEN